MGPAVQWPWPKNIIFILFHSCENGKMGFLGARFCICTTDAATISNLTPVSLCKWMRQTNSATNKMNETKRKKSGILLDTFLGVTENDNFHFFPSLSFLWFAWKTLAKKRTSKREQWSEKKSQNDCRATLPLVRASNWTYERDRMRPEFIFAAFESFMCLVRFVSFALWIQNIRRKNYFGSLNILNGNCLLLFRNEYSFGFVLSFLISIFRAIFKPW